MKNVLRSKLFIFLILAFILRIYFIFQAYHGDLNNNISWGTISFENGLRGLYDHAYDIKWIYSVPNQPPLTILLFYTLRALWVGLYNFIWLLNNSFGIFPSSVIWFWERWGMIMLVKLPSILADFGIAYFIFKIVNMLTKSELKAKVLSLIWLINPIVWYNSSVWGQTDSIVNLLGLWAIVSLFNKNFVKFTVIMTLSFLFKGSLLVLFPVIFLIILKQRYSISAMFKGFCVSILTIFLVSIWFHPAFDFPIWLVNLYQTRIIPGEIGFLTANAFNFWWLINSGKVYDSGIFLGLSYRLWGIIITLVFLSIVCFATFRKYTSKKAILVFMLSGLISFLFLTRVHERYLYPFFPYATITLAFIPQSVYIYCVLVLSHLINLYNLFWYPPFPLLENLLKRNTLGNILSIVNLLCLGLLILIFKKSKSLDTS